MADLDFRVRDLLPKYVPEWLSDRLQNGLTNGYRYLWGLNAPLDALLDTLNAGLAAHWPGVGTPTALPYIGRSRGLIRNQGESDAAYAARLIKWLDTWPQAASQEIIGVAIHEFLASKPRVRVIRRSGHWLTVNADGTIVRQEAAWNWDTVSHPERNDPEAPWWSDLWVVVQSPWAARSGTLNDLPTDSDGFAWGHLATFEEVDAVHGLFDQWKGLHSRIRAVIWTTDATLFNPTNPATCPNGKWGAWGMYDGTSYVPSDRNITTCRYWEPR